MVGGSRAAASVHVDGEVDPERTVQTGTILAESNKGLEAAGGHPPRRKARS